MYLTNIKIKNFRKIKDDFNLDLNEGLNVLIGENNLGKTAVVEAISACLSVGDISKAVRIVKDDFNDQSQPIEITLTFSSLSTEQQASFLQGLQLEQNALTNAKLVLKFEFSWRDDRPLLKIYSGETQNQVKLQGDDFFSYLTCTYLQALRDVNHEFRVGRSNRISTAIKSRFQLDADKEDKQFKMIFDQANQTALSYSYENEDGKEVKPILDYQTDTNSGIAKLSLDDDDNTISLEFVDTHFDHLLKGLIMKTNGGSLDIYRNGLGYNNLIYISTILADLADASATDSHTFHCLIVEEPEAHLHPQLQRLLLSYLKENFSGVQIILTSHSPTIASDTPLNKLSIISRGQDLVQGIPVASSIPDLQHQALLQRYLDVTRSQLFFARRVIFVEGITEAMLFRAFWDYHFTNPEMKYDRKGVEIVNIDGVSFEPYVDLVKNIYKKTNVKAVVVTDDDRGTKCSEQQSFTDANGNLKSTEQINEIFDTAPKSKRFTKLESLVSDLRKDQHSINIFGAKKTFEVEIGMQKDQNIDLLSGFAGVTFSDKIRSNPQLVGIELWKKVKNNKAEFAEKLLNWLSQDDREGNFVVPQYIKSAFDFLVQDNDNPNSTTTSGN